MEYGDLRLDGVSSSLILRNFESDMLLSKLVLWVVAVDFLNHRWKTQLSA